MCETWLSIEPECHLLANLVHGVQYFVHQCPICLSLAGGIYMALSRSGCLSHMVERNIECLDVYCVDNLLARLGDPLFLGYCHAKVDARFYEGPWPQRWIELGPGVGVKSRCGFPHPVPFLTPCPHQNLTTVSRGLRWGLVWSRRPIRRKRCDRVWAR